MLLGIVVILMGIGLIVFSGPLTEVVGRREWADRHLGGTTQGFVLIGFGIIVLGGFMMFGGEVKPEAPTAFPGAVPTQAQ